jgi:type I restriction enzyme S subunit
MVEWKKLGEVCSNVYAGGTPSTKHSEYYDGNIPWIRSGEVDFNVIKTAERNITEEGYKNSSAKKIRKKSVVMAMTGATVAKTAVVEIETTANQSVCAMETDENIIGYKYLYYFLAKNYFTIKSSAQGALTSINLAMIKDIPIPIPSISEQERIVGILDTFTASIDNIKAQIEQRRKQYEHYRNTLLDLEGKEGVEMKTLPEISVNKDRARKPITSSKRKAGIYPYYGASGIVDYVDGYIFDGDFLLISEDGANLVARSTPIAFSIKGKNWVNNHAHVLQFKDKATKKYVEIYLNMIDLEPWINGAAQPKLNQDNLNKITIPIPTLARQQEIVSILDTFEASITNLEAQLEQRQKQYEYYREELLTNLS